MRTELKKIDVSDIEFDEVETVAESDDLSHLLVQTKTEDGEPVTDEDGNKLIERPIDGVGNLTPVVNKTRGKLVSMNGRNYNLLKNEKFMSMIQEVTGDSFIGVVQKDLKRMAVYFFPQEEAGTDLEEKSFSVGDNGDEITLGLRFVNSYDASSSLKADFVGIRMACSNGMIATDIVDSKRVEHSINTLKAEEFRSYIETMYKDAPLEELKAVLEESKEITLPEGSEIEWIAGFAERHNLTNILTKWLMKEVEQTDGPITRYQLWNMVTRTLTHGGHKSQENHLAKWQESTLENKHKTANKILLEPEEEDSDLVSRGKEALCEPTTIPIDGTDHATTVATKMNNQIEGVYGVSVDTLRELYYKEPEPLNGRSPESIITPSEVELVAEQ